MKNNNSQTGKKYKLVKNYPGCRWPLGTTCVNVGYRYNIIDEHGCFDYEINKFMIEDFPEFWEEVVEPLYKVLSFKGNKTGFLYTLRGDKYYVDGANYNAHTLEQLLLTNLYRIHSIERVLDGEVFTVGDLIDGPCGKNQEIVRIDTDWIYYHNEKHSTYTYRLSDIKKVIKPIFTTDDGVKLFNGDHYYYVLQDFQIISDVAKVNTKPSNGLNQLADFSTKELAQEFVTFNKRFLSVNDIINEFENKKTFTFEALKEFAKSRV